MSTEQTNLLKQFVELCKENPALLYQPQLAFYREYLESMGAKLPPPTTTPGMKENATPSSGERKASGENKKKFEEQQEEEPELELDPPELDNAGVIEDKTGNEEYPMGDLNKETTEEDLEKANEHRDSATAFFNEGDFQKALEHYTKAIELNAGSAILHAKRANTLLKMSKLSAAIKDCDKAIIINPDSAAPYKFRGRAHRLLGNWLEAHKDLAISCKLDYDDVAYEWLKEVEPNTKKLQEYQRTKERFAEEKELRDRRERVRRAQEAKKQADVGGNEGGGGTAGGFGMGPFTELFKEFADDPELLNELKNDPSLAKKLIDVMQNPGNIMQYINDPKIMNLFGKLAAKMGASDTGPTFPNTTEKPKKAPEPDLD